MNKVIEAIENRINTLTEFRKTYVKQKESRESEQAWARIDELKKLKEKLKSQEDTP